MAFRSKIMNIAPTKDRQNKGAIEYSPKYYVVWVPYEKMVSRLPDGLKVDG